MGALGSPTDREMTLASLQLTITSTNAVIFAVSPADSASLGNLFMSLLARRISPLRCGHLAVFTGLFHVGGSVAWNADLLSVPWPGVVVA